MLKYTNYFFNSVWDMKSKGLILDMMRVFLEACEAHQVNPILMYGSLIGCMRNNHIIPWDGDVDFCVDNSLNYSNVKQYLIDKNLQVFLFHDGIKSYNYYMCMRICSKQGKKTLDNWSWPWIDVYFYKKDKEFVNFINCNKTIFYKANTEDIFPLKKSIFENFQVNTPASSVKILNDMYPNWSTVYESSKFDHRTTLKNKIIHRFEVR